MTGQPSERQRLKVGRAAMRAMPEISRATARGDYPEAFARLVGIFRDTGSPVDEAATLGLAALLELAPEIFARGR